MNGGRSQVKDRTAKSTRSREGTGSRARVGPAQQQLPSPDAQPQLLSQPQALVAKRVEGMMRLQRVIGNHAVARVASTARVRAPGIIQRVINGQMNQGPIANVRAAAYPDLSVPTYDWALLPLTNDIPAVMGLILAYNNGTGVGPVDAQLTQILAGMRDIESLYLAQTIPYMTRMENQSDADKASYEALLLLRDEWTVLMRAVNNEIAAHHGVQRQGAGGRPDVKESVGATLASGSLNLSEQEKTWVKTFLQSQGTTAKTTQEALTAVWAKRANYFQNLSSGKNNPYKKKERPQMTADVEYQTTDPNKPKIWDQKAITIGEGQATYEGRLEKTYKKAVDTTGQAAPVGLLFDSTFADPRNYEIAWGAINEMLMTGVIPATAVKEVRAPTPGAFLSDLYVRMADKISEDDPNKSKKHNIKWAEGLQNGAQNGPPRLYTIPRNRLPGGNRLAQILNGTIMPYSRYANDRSWLPTGVVYNEYGSGITGTHLSETDIKFVLSANLQQIYLTVTHYKAYTVTPARGQPEARNPFFRIL
jgi:hypothetical protein